jgi:hypothetical protein
MLSVKVHRARCWEEGVVDLSLQVEERRCTPVIGWQVQLFQFLLPFGNVNDDVSDFQFEVNMYRSILPSWGEELVLSYISHNGNENILKLDLS